MRGSQEPARPSKFYSRKTSPPSPNGPPAMRLVDEAPLITGLLLLDAGFASTAFGDITYADADVIKALCLAAEPEGVFSS